MSNDKTGATRREFLTGLTAAAAAATMAGALTQAANAQMPAPRLNRNAQGQPYNILFVFTDQERFNKPMPRGLSLPGHERLQRTGTTFLNHYICAVMCSSSRANLVTGLHTPDNGIFENLNVPWVKDLSTSLPTYGRMMGQSNYYAAYKGKWHLSRAFDQHDADRLFTKEMEAYGFQDYASPGDLVGHTLGGYQFDDLISGSAVTWLRRRGAVLNEQGKPWCLTTSLVNPHDIMYFDSDAPGQKVQDNGRLLAHAAPAPNHPIYKAKWNDALPASLGQPLDAPGRPGAHREYQTAWDLLLGHMPNEKARWERFSDYYINCIRAVDQQLVRMFAELDALGMTDRTIVVFTADHGEMGGAHGLRGKGPFVYEDNIHVPLYVVHPDVKGGQSCKALTSHIDIAPSLLAMAGVDAGKVAELAGRKLPGRDFTPLLNAPAKADANAIREGVLFTYSGLATNDSNVLKVISDAAAKGANPRDPATIAKLGLKPDLKKRGTVRSVFDGRYKFTRYFAPVDRHSPANMDQLVRNNDLELFDLKTDPKEMTNLAVGPKSDPKLVMAMSDKLEAVIKAEIGVDDGREMPEFKTITWELDSVD